MAYQFTVNQTPASACVAMQSFLQTLLAAGWLVKGYGDGLSLFSNSVSLSSSPFGNGGSGAGNFGNFRAWFRVQQPTWNGGSTPYFREFIIQTGTQSGQDYMIRIKYSPGLSGGFNQLPISSVTGTGAPVRAGVISPTTTPSALDEVIFNYEPGVGIGYDAAPTFNALFDTGGTYRLHCCAGQASENYSFNLFVTGAAFSSSLIRSAFTLDVMQPGSYSPQDLDPSVTYIDNFETNIYGHGLQQNGVGFRSSQGFMAGISGGNYLPYPAVLPQNMSPFWTGISAMNYSSSVPAGMGTNAWTGKDDNLPIPWVHNLTGTQSNTGFKGWGTLLCMNGVQRNALDTVTIVTPGDHIYYNGTLMPWPGMLIASVSNAGGLIEITTSQYLNMVSGSSVLIAGTGTSADSTTPWTITQVDNTHFTLNSSTFVSGSSGSGTLSVTPLI